MKIPNKRELQQIVFNHSSDIDFQDFMNLYKKCTTNPYSFFVIDTTLASNISLRFRKNLLERISWQLMIKFMMENYNAIVTEKQQISALSSGKIDKYDYFTGEEILPFDQSRII